MTFAILSRFIRTGWLAALTHGETANDNDFEPQNASRTGKPMENRP